MRMAIYKRAINKIMKHFRLAYDIKIFRQY
jgi:hypothetical protein